jgi:hypothetical protein
MVPRTGLEPACLAALPPQGSVSAIPPPGHRKYGKGVYKLRECRLVCLVHFNWQNIIKVT